MNHFSLAMGCEGPIDVAVIITNFHYKSYHKDLPAAEKDGRMMSKMLQNYNKKYNKTSILTAANVNLKKQLKKFRKQVKEKVGEHLKGKQIENLHFHFSGHGEFRETDTSGIHAHHLIGSDGERLSEFDLKTCC